MLRAFLVTLLALLLGAASAGQSSVAFAGREMELHYFKPAGDGPFPAVLFVHGRAPVRSQRDMLESAVPASHAEWWVRQGFAVIAPVRPGYGATGGPDREDTGARWRGSSCVGIPEFQRVAHAARDAMLAAHQWALQQPWVQRDRLLVEGYSLGGLGAVAVAAANPPGVVGVVNFSGGTAGNPFDSPGRSCRPDLLAKTYADLGRQARVPSLWLYAANDKYWGVQAPLAWHRAYRAGGSDSELVVTRAVGADGHHLLFEGQDHWQGPLARFARRLGVPLGSPGHP